MPKRLRTRYTLSKKASEVHECIRAAFPHAKVYVEYPYVFLLKKYYKKNDIPGSEQNSRLLFAGRLLADFAIPDYYCVIEVDGEQHFGPVRFGGIDKEKAEELFADQVYRDELKRRICKEMDYRLVQIKYYDSVSPEYIFELVSGAKHDNTKEL